MAHSVRRHLHLEVRDYDRVIRRWIPAYETMLEVAAAAVAEADARRVLDLGAGTGALAEAIFLAVPELDRVDLLDVDPEMLELARVRLGPRADRVGWIEGPFGSLAGSWDAVASSLALHHVPTLAEKSSIFGRIFEALPPGGVFVNADATMPVDGEERERLFRYWAEHQMAHGYTESEAFAHFREWSEEDHYQPLEAELAALRGWGFEAERIWAAGPIGVVRARKPASPTSVDPGPPSRCR